MGRISQNSSYSSRLQDASRYQEGPLTVILWTTVQDPFTGFIEPQAATIRLDITDLSTSPIRYTSTPLSPEHATVLPSAFLFLREALATERYAVLEGAEGMDTGELDGGVWWASWFLEDALPLVLPWDEAIPEPSGPPSDPYGIPTYPPTPEPPDAIPVPEPEPTYFPVAEPPLAVPVPEPEPYTIPEAVPPLHNQEGARQVAQANALVDRGALSALLNADYPAGPDGPWGAPLGWFVRGPGF